MTTPSLTNPNPKREDERVGDKVDPIIEAIARSMFESEEFDWEAAKRQHRTTARGNVKNVLRHARIVAPQLFAPSPGDPVRAVISEAQLYAAMDAFYPGENWRVDLGIALESALRDMKSALRAALSVSTPTGEGEEPCPHPHRYDRGECCGGDCRPVVKESAALVKRSLEHEALFSGTVLVEDNIEEPAALAHPQQGGERDGWKLVPVEPTEEMLEAAENTAVSGYSGTPVITPGSAWSAMLATAPTSPSKSSGEEA